MELYLHSPNMLSWCDAQLEHRDTNPQTIGLCGTISFVTHIQPKEGVTELDEFISMTQETF